MPYQTLIFNSFHKETCRLNLIVMNPGSYEYMYENSKELFTLWEKGLISPDDEEFNEFEILKEVAFIEHIYSRVSFLTFEFLGPYTTSFAREYTLANEIAMVNEKIQQVKSNHSKVYAEVLNGHDGRINLSYDEIRAIFNLDYKLLTQQPLSLHMELLIYIKYLGVLQWIGKTENKGVVDDYHSYLREQKSNLRWPPYRESKRLRQLIDKVAQKEQVSYTWQNNPNKELTELYQRLIDKQLLHPTTTVEKFQAVFTAKPLKEVQPINWIGAKNLLAYFIDYIFENRLIHFNTNQWSVAEKCFTDGKELIKSKNRYLDNKSSKHPGKPKNYHLIDDALKGL
ncbi:hypothetical protein Q4E40_03895 [Pontibacter sp. BT731]|uniref:hypothetical protein n=1 Tax=Pontibacter coccineus TaxID=3063328 RepID=UPI0026E36D3D|nr:hypothetical protein [Pontibacter sp. BT731]MDO6389256.1 hypothetical protein [Pontibacter sp. BT731]